MSVISDCHLVGIVAEGEGNEEELRMKCVFALYSCACMCMYLLCFTCAGSDAMDGTCKHSVV